MESSPAFLRGGFRPFFLAGAAWAVIALSVWLYVLATGGTLPSTFDPLSWHRHEMLFGFVGAVIAGFLLTAIPNWTGQLPIAGAPLAALASFWLLGRLAVLFSSVVGGMLAAILDAGFYVLLALIAAREVLRANNRNVPIVGIVLLFGLANSLDHASVLGLPVSSDLAWQLAVLLVVILISLVGGRIVPSFTRNWLTKQGIRDGLPTQPGKFDLAVIALTGFALLGWMSAPAGVPSGSLLLAAALAQAVRLIRWRGWRAAADPLVLVLHVGYAWLPIGLALLGAVQIGAPLPRSAAVHALTAGAMATMILAVMTRATLGHTGRELRASRATVLCYLLVTIGAVLRVTAALQLVDYRVGMEIAGAAWIGAFLLFLGAYGPMLFTPRVDGKP
ncbi:NnrS family protein [Sphingomonas mesophila]|uniref:NnrS family protein n=1 Tax=Sphingomonas mesophila TaxID=2303576 RepID=UPI000E5771D5|nr:NnrS family protein [Sphingomonas mesophila]